MRIKIDKPNDTSIDNEKELELEPKTDPIKPPKAKTSSAIWYYCSDAVSNLIGGGVTGNLPDISNQSLSKDQQFNIELAVAAGNIYHMLLGEPQPKFYSGSDGNGKYYRLSKEVPNYKDWGECIEEIEVVQDEATNNVQDEESNSTELDGKQYTVLGNKLVKGTNTFVSGDQNGEIKKIVSTAIVSFFLADVDTNPGNFGLVNCENIYHMIKLDPECCFNSFFFEQNQDAIYNGLSDIVHNHSADFKANFVDNFTDHSAMNDDGSDLIDNYIDWDVVTGFMNTESANQEKFQIIYKIINTSLEEYELILRSCIDKKYDKEIRIILNGLENRLKLFSQCANSLEGYQEYCAQINPPVETELETLPNEEAELETFSNEETELETLPNEETALETHPNEENVDEISGNKNIFFSKRKAETQLNMKSNKKSKTDNEQSQQNIDTIYG